MNILNDITDIAGIRVGNAHDERIATGVTIVLFDEPVVASVFVPGGGPAGRDQECLEPHRTVDRIHAIALSGGSGYGLDAGGGVQAFLRERGRGLRIREALIPLVPTAILFDLLNGGDKAWGRFPPYRDLAFRACEAAEGASGPVRLGTSGAGFGATTVDLKGGLGSASCRTTGGATIGVIVAVNAIASGVIDGGPHFWSAPFERDGEFGGLGWPPRGTSVPPLAWKGGLQPATTIALVATDASLTKGEAKRLAMMASTGLGKALRLAFAPSDGDTIFVASTQRRSRDLNDDLTELGALASDCLARAISRGIYEAERLAIDGTLPSWKEKFGKSVG